MLSLCGAHNQPKHKQHRARHEHASSQGVGSGTHCVNLNVGLRLGETAKYARRTAEQAAFIRTNAKECNTNAHSELGVVANKLQQVLGLHQHQHQPSKA